MEHDKQLAMVRNLLSMKPSLRSWALLTSISMDKHSGMAGKYAKAALDAQYLVMDRKSTLFVMGRESTLFVKAGPTGRGEPATFTEGRTYSIEGGECKLWGGEEERTYYALVYLGEHTRFNLIDRLRGKDGGFRAVSFHVFEVLHCSVYKGDYDSMLDSIVFGTEK